MGHRELRERKEMQSRLAALEGLPEAVCNKVCGLLHSTPLDYMNSDGVRDGYTIRTVIDIGQKVAEFIDAALAGSAQEPAEPGVNHEE